MSFIVQFGRVIRQFFRSKKSKMALRHWEIGMEWEAIKYNQDRRERASEIQIQMAANEEEYPGLVFCEHYPYTEKYMWRKTCM